MSICAGMNAVNVAAAEDGFETCAQTNHHSHFLLTQLLLPALEAAAQQHGQARVVNHSSLARRAVWHSRPLEARFFERNGNWGANGFLPSTVRYQQTKLANYLFTLALQVCISKLSGCCRCWCLSSIRHLHNPPPSTFG